MIKGDKIFLRKLTVSDAAKVLIWENNSDVWRFSNTDSNYALRDIESLINTDKTVPNTKQLRLMICKHNEECIGLVDLFDINFKHNRAALGILIANPDERGNGYAEEALKIVIKYAYKIYGITNFHCTIQSDNAASIRLFEKLKFDRVGERKKWYKIDEHWINEYFYQRIIK